MNIKEIKQQYREKTIQSRKEYDLKLKEFAKEYNLKLKQSIKEYAIENGMADYQIFIFYTYYPISNEDHGYGYKNIDDDRLDICELINDVNDITVHFVEPNTKYHCCPYTSPFQGHKLPL